MVDTILTKSARIDKIPQSAPRLSIAMKSVTLTLAFTLLLVTLLFGVEGASFIVPGSPRAHCCSTPVALNLFGFGNAKKDDDAKHRVYQGMSKKEEAIRKKNTYQGPKITVREDEDAAMWVEADDRNRNEEQRHSRRTK